MQECKDHIKIVIVGCGVAGSTLLKFLQKSNNDEIEILTLEQSSLYREDTREAELVEETIQFLKENNYKVPYKVFSTPRYLDIRHVDLENGIQVYQNRKLWNINRSKFNQWLIKEVEKETKILENVKVNRLELTPSEIKIIAQEKGSNKSIVIRCDKVVGADGVKSIVRKFTSAPRLKIGLGVQEWIKPKRPFTERCTYFIYDSSISKFYSWVIPKDDIIVVGTALLPGENHKALDILKKKLKKYNLVDVDGSVLKRKVDMAVRSSPDQIYFGERNIFLIGEAAGLISPATAEGISFALRSGKYCAEVISSGEGLTEYIKKCENLVTEIEEKYKKLKILQDRIIRLKLLTSLGECEKLNSY